MYLKSRILQQPLSIMVGLGMFAALSSVTCAQDVSDWQRHYDCVRNNGPIVIDGVGDEFAWQLAPEVGVFTRFQHDDMTPEYRTTAKMLWDEDHLYLLVAVDDPDIWSTMEEGDKDCLCKEETIELFIDADGDEKDYAEIHINCLNTINDIWIPQNNFKYADGASVDWTDLYAWPQEGMRHAVKNYGTVNDPTDVDRGSVFELAMPWKGFGKIAGTANIPPRPGDVWRINVNRYERPRSRDGELKKVMELSGWAPLDLSSYHVPERFGYVRFVETH
jgi:hypothetical protein